MAREIQPISALENMTIEEFKIRYEKWKKIKRNAKQQIGARKRSLNREV